MPEMDTVSTILLADPRYCELYQTVIGLQSAAASARSRADAARLVGDLNEFVRGARAYRAAMETYAAVDLQLQDVAIAAVERWLDEAKKDPQSP